MKKHHLKYRFYKFIILIAGCALSQVVSADNSDYEKALSSFQQGQYEEAYIHVKNALQDNPRDLSAKVLLSKLLVKNKLYKEAETQIREAIQQRVDINLVFAEWAETLLNLKKYKQLVELDYSARLSQKNQMEWNIYKATACINLLDYQCSNQFYQQNLAVDAGHIESINGLATIALIEKNYALANNQIESALQVSTENAETWRLKGQLARSQGDIQQAILHLNRALEINPTEPAIARNLVDAYIASNDLDKAFSLSDKLLVESPNDLYVQFARNWLAVKTANDSDGYKQMQVLANRLNGLPRYLIDEYPTFSYLRGTVSFLLGQYQSARDDLAEYNMRTGGEFQSAYLLAKTYSALYDFDAALETFEKYQMQITNNLSQSLFLGGLYLVNHKPHRAVALLDRLEGDFSEQVEYKLFAVQVAISRGKTDAALAELDNLITAYPNNKMVLIEHCMVNMDAKRLNAANQSLTKLKKLIPNDVDVKNLDTAMLIMQSQDLQAMAAIQNVLAENPESYSALYNLATVQSRLKRYPEALLTLEKLLSINTSDIAVKLRLARINLAMSNTDKANNLYQSILKQDINNLQAMEGLLQINELQANFTPALRLAQSLQRLEPRYPLYVLKEAQLLIKLKDNDKALRAINKYEKLIEKTAFNLLALSQLYLAINEKEKALIAVAQAHQLKPKDINLHLQYVSQLITLNHLTQAEKQLKTLQQSNATNPDVLLKLGELNDAKQQFDVAKQYYFQILEIDDKYELALAKLYAHVANGMSDKEFLTVLNHIVNKYPEAYFPRSLLAQFHFYYGQSSIAIEQYQYLLETDNMPNKAALLNRLAYLYLPDDLNRSEDYSLQALALDSNNVTILSNYGWILAKQGNYEKSITVLRDAITRDASNPELKYHLAYTLEKLGKTDQAKRLLNEVLASNVFFTEKTDAELLLKEIEKR
ncbi:PEP-CTERM system TPR-repeat protein PrsT [Aliiglaciecola sp. 3_MG-2023]|uniref:XrtA/PEP-CTERM system TPR-repeat protein PrsT n=1 Tax=Aliiglaciecola sp. 3_MG-2023 TaxID=3062644 RepID=UPI0026E1222D|nr:XrtA/PEP-CTERM system TPR-repeat protein PrsT [Aliiglaciecola sp. 3_MG-2023]MDO6694849.1 PEP-CTERM system TPR-repeat protein PrsT [Aliiglaciecola sp. 3_MG-2023]